MWGGGGGRVEREREGGGGEWREREREKERERERERELGRHSWTKGQRVKSTTKKNLTAADISRTLLNCTTGR